MKKKECECIFCEGNARVIKELKNANQYACTQCKAHFVLNNKDFSDRYSVLPSHGTSDALATFFSQEQGVNLVQKLWKQVVKLSERIGLENSTKAVDSELAEFLSQDNRQQFEKVAAWSREAEQQSRQQGPSRSPWEHK